MIEVLFNLAVPFAVLAILIYSHRKARRTGILELFFFEIDRHEQPTRFKRWMVSDVFLIAFMAIGCTGLIIRIVRRLISPT